jgi:hypothetical protein
VAGKGQGSELSVDRVFCDQAALGGEAVESSRGASGALRIDFLFTSQEPAGTKKAMENGISGPGLDPGCSTQLQAIPLALWILEHGAEHLEGLGG